MSNPFKAIGKAFKSVVRVVKKIALPALAIAAVVLTGGAALGVLPSVGSVLGGIGISASSTLGTVLMGAAKAATFGAVGSALTGGNIVKGATAGFITGGLLGGANAALGGLGKAAQAGAGGLGNASSINQTALESLRSGTSAATSGASGAVTQGLGNVANAAVQSGGVAAATGAPAIAPVAASAAPVSSGGVMGFLNRNPIVGGMVVQGLGQGLMANEQNKAAQRERDQIAANYADTSGLPQYQSQGNNGYSQASDVFNAAIYAGKKVSYDPNTGKLKVGN